MHHSKISTISILFCLAVLPLVALADHAEVTTIEVHGVPPLSPSRAELHSVISKGPIVDNSSVLEEIPGVELGRMGGHGLEPVIRGQQQWQLNIMEDDGFVHGGCPNRMDPPMSISSLDSDTIIEVERGYQSVRHGPGGSGGTVKISRNDGFVSNSEPPSVNAGIGFDSNPGAWNKNAALKAAAENYAIQIQGHHRDSGNYEDGNGREIRSAVKDFGGSARIAFKTEAGGVLKVGASKSRVEDALFEGALMDTPLSEIEKYNFELKLPFSTESVNWLSFKANYSTVDHTMDNFSLRPRERMFALADSDSDTLTLKAELGIDSDHETILGVDFTQNDRDSRRFMNMMSSTRLTQVQSVLWPNISIQQFGLYTETTKDLSDSLLATLGIRYQRVEVDAGAADLKADLGAMRSPNQLYTAYYGKSFDSQEEDHLNAVLRLEKQLSSRLNLFGTLSHSMRTADSTERGIASDMGSGPGSWIGNPDISPEAHRQAELGVAWHPEGNVVSASVYYDDVDDYIFRDRARGQQGILLSDGATIYRNTDATLLGAELDLERELSDQFTLAGNLSYVRGKNDKLNIPLPQISPLTARVEGRYKSGDISVVTRVRAAANQSRVDDNVATGSGRDVRKTPGYAVLDLIANIEKLDGVAVSLGVTNIFDKNFARHLNRSNAFDVEEIQVNEPGRSLFFGVSGEF